MLFPADVQCYRTSNSIGDNHSCHQESNRIRSNKIITTQLAAYPPNVICKAKHRLEAELSDLWRDHAVKHNQSVSQSSAHNKSRSVETKLIFSFLTLSLAFLIIAIAIFFLIYYKVIHDISKEDSCKILKAAGITFGIVLAMTIGFFLGRNSLEKEQMSGFHVPERTRKLERAILTHSSSTDLEGFSVQLDPDNRPPNWCPDHFKQDWDHHLLGKCREIEREIREKARYYRERNNQIDREMRQSCRPNLP